ncbi:MAG: ABC transporter ATP-binding protein, partial [Oligoflexus sp.]|nr:ABC transporter ATP-binding protein [Oligoflexus sp.]
FTTRISQATDETILELKALTKVYTQKKHMFARPEAFHAVDAVDLKVRKGMRLGIVGESGCGKTTLARSIIRLVEPSSGSILFDGQDITHLSEFELMPIRRRIQYIFQNPYAALNPRMTIGEIVTEPLVIHGLGGSQQDRWNAAAAQIEAVGLSAEMLQRFPHEFSGGQRQRICIARALMLDPEILVCDECVSALDVSVQAQILNLLQDIQDKRGITFIFISHDLAVVKYFSEEICVMSKGKIIERGDADEIYAHPQHSFTQRLLNAIPKGIPKGALTAAPSYY